MNLNGHFALNSVLRRYVWSSEAWFISLATLKLLVNVIAELNFKIKRTAATSRGFFATARLSCVVLAVCCHFGEMKFDIVI